MKILDCEREVRLDGIVLIVTENEALGLRGALDCVLKDNATADCMPSDEDDGPFVTVGMYGCEVDDF